MSIRDPWLDSRVRDHLNDIHDRVDVLENAITDTDSLDDDQLSRLGINNVVPDEPRVTLRQTIENGLGHTVAWGDTAVGDLTMSPDLHLTGQATIDGELTVHGFTSLGNVATDILNTQHLTVNSFNVETELNILRGQNTVLEGRIIQLEEQVRRLLENGQDDSESQQE